MYNVLTLFQTKIISPEEKKIVAYHEAGHAIVGLNIKVIKVQQYEYKR